MRISTVFRRLLGVTKMFVQSVLFRPDGSLAIEVRPSWRLSRCGQCSRQQLYRAYLLKETLAEVLDQDDIDLARELLRDWLSWASRSRLKPFVKTARTIRKHFDGILAYVETRLTNGLTEGFNYKLRVIARRAYGFHSPQPLIAMLLLSCGGIKLNPPLARPAKS